MKLAAHKKVVAAVAAGLVVLLSACTPINSAATIGEKSISVGQVQKTVDEILSERAKVSTQGMTLETGEALNRSQLTFFVISELLFQLGKRAHISVTDKEINAEIKSITTQVGGAANLSPAMVSAGVAPANLREYFRSYLLSSKLSNALISNGIPKESVTAAVQKLVADEAAKLKISINPRYGSWSSDQATIINAPLAAGSVQK